MVGGDGELEREGCGDWREKGGGWGGWGTGERGGGWGRLQPDLEKTGATINKINSLFCDLSSQLNQAFNIYVCQTLLQHHAQTIPPDIMDDYSARVTPALVSSALLQRHVHVVDAAIAL